MPKSEHPTERERRWVVTEFDRTILSSWHPVKKIIQGYFDVLGERSFRVRIIDEMRAVVTLKEGSGEIRTERELPVGMPVARLMLEATSFQVSKERHEIDGWELDVFNGPLSGVVILEYEAEGNEPIPPLPTWIKQADDVTDRMTNLHLARLAREVTDSTPIDLRPHLVPRLPKIVLTGGPCSGKSTLMRELSESFGDVVHCVPEVATILILQVGFHSFAKNLTDFLKFQSILYRVQRSFEEAAEIQAIADGKKALLLDRGTLDALAYLSDPNLFDVFAGTSIWRERKRYEHVLFLDPPTREVYEKHAQDNPARRESYTQALMLSTRTFTAWDSMDPDGYGLGVSRTRITGETWEDKRENAFQAMKEIMQRTK